MTMARAFALWLVGALLIWSSDAFAQLAICGNRPAIVMQLARKYQEFQRATGLIDSGRAKAELYVSRKGTWTMLVTMTNGKSCIVAAGTDWDSAIVSLKQGQPI